MAKPSQGRFDGLYGMRKFTAQELFAWADQYESRIPANFDDPKWLQRRADRIRRLAIAKEQALELKLREERQITRRCSRLVHRDVKRSSFGRPDE